MTQVHNKVNEPGRAETFNREIFYIVIAGVGVIAAIQYASHYLATVCAGILAAFLCFVNWNLSAVAWPFHYDTSRANTFFFIDTAGKRTSRDYAYVEDFSEGLAAVRPRYWSDLTEYIASDGTAKLKGFRNGKSFSEGLASVEWYGRACCINTSGKLVIQPKYDYIERFSEGWARVFNNRYDAEFQGLGTRGDKYFFVDHSGNEHLKNMFRYIGSFKGLYAQAETLDGKEVIIDKTGKTIAETYMCFSEGLRQAWREEPKSGSYEVMLNSWIHFFEQYGYCDEQGQLVIGYRFSEARDFSNGLAAVKITKRRSKNSADSEKGPLEAWGYINKSGETVIDFQFDEAFDFVKDKDTQLMRARIRQNNRYGFIDETGKIMVSAEYDEAYDFSEGFAAVKKNDCWGFVDAYGKQIIPLQYDLVHSFGEGRAAVQKKKFSVIDWFYPGFWDIWNEYESFKGVFRPGFRVEE